MKELTGQDVFTAYIEAVNTDAERCHLQQPKQYRWEDLDERLQALYHDFASNLNRFIRGQED